MSASRTVIVTLTGERPALAGLSRAARVAALEAWMAQQKRRVDAALSPLRADDPTLTVHGLDTMVPVLTVTSTLPDLEARLGALEGVLDVSPSPLVRVA